MLAVMEFIFSGFWTWLGTFLLICAVGSVIGAIRK